MSTSVTQSLPRGGDGLLNGAFPSRAVSLGRQAVRASISVTPMDIFLGSSLPGFGRSIRSLVGLEIELAFAGFARIVAMSDCFQRGLSISDQPD